MRITGGDAGRRGRWRHLCELPTRHLVAQRQRGRTATSPGVAAGSGARGHSTLDEDDGRVATTRRETVAAPRSRRRACGWRRGRRPTLTQHRRSSGNVSADASAAGSTRQRSMTLQQRLDHREQAPPAPRRRAWRRALPGLPTATRRARPSPRTHSSPATTAAGAEARADFPIESTHGMLRRGRHQRLPLQRARSEQPRRRGRADRAAGEQRRADAHPCAPRRAARRSTPAPRRCPADDQRGVARPTGAAATSAPSRSASRPAAAVTSSAAPAAAPDEELPPPVAGKSVNALPARGTVRIRLPGTNRFVELEEGQQIPVGTVIDTRKGRVTLVAANNKSGGTATATFYDGIFRLGQTQGRQADHDVDSGREAELPEVAARRAPRRRRRRSAGCGATERAASGRRASTARRRCAARSG